MPPKVRVIHTTLYRYDRNVRVGPQSIRLRPMQGTRAPIEAYALRVDPKPLSIHWQQDPLGNTLARIVLQDATEHLEVVVDLVADLSPQDPFNFLLEPDAADWPFAYKEAAGDLVPFRKPDHPGPAMAALRAESPNESPTVTLLLDLTRRVRDRVAYITRMEEGVWTPDHTLAEGRGSCRDSAWMLVQLLRMHGIAARFVSGYLVQLSSDGGPDTAELHAWGEAFLPGAGWIGLDATSGLLTSEGHIPLAASPHPIASAPVTGTVEPSDAVLETSTQVLRVS